MQSPVIQQTVDGPMATGATPALLLELLTHYEAELSDRGVPIDRWLNPGIPEDEIRSSLARHGLQSPEEIVIWFGWHDGISTAADFPKSRRALPSMQPVSLDQALATYEELREMVRPTRWPNGTAIDPSVFDWGAGEGWLRLGEDNYGCAVNCAVGGAAPVQIRYTNPDFGLTGDEDKYRAVSLCTLATWWLDALDAGAYTWVKRTESWIEDVALLPETQLAAHFG